MLEVRKLSAELDGKQILTGVDLVIKPGEKHLLLGANGAGKSSLAMVLMGSPKYEVLSGEILLDGEDLTTLPPEERARRGMFLGFQHPVELPGISLFQFIRSSIKERGETPSYVSLKNDLNSALAEHKLSKDFMEKNVNEGSGGEKKRLELIQAMVLKPKYAVLDEIDSGVDLVSQAKIIESMKSLQAGILVISHRRFSEEIQFDQVHLMAEGTIVRSGGLELYKELA